jgi:hypothetical protein
MFGTIIKDFFTIIFILVLGFVGSFHLFIKNNDKDLQFRIMEISQFVNSQQNEKLDKFEGRLNIFIINSEENNFVYLACPFSYLHPNFLYWDDASFDFDNDHNIMNIKLGDEGRLFHFRSRKVKIDELRTLKPGQILSIEGDFQDENRVLFWRSKKILPKNLLD